MDPIRLHELSRRALIPALLGLALIGQMGLCASAEASGTEAKLVDRFYIMDTWFWENGCSVEDEVKYLLDLGVKRTCYSIRNWDNVPSTLAALKAAGIELVSLYATVNIDSEEVPENVQNLFKQLKGTNAFVWMSLVSEKYERSDPAGDESAVKLLRRASDLAKASGIGVSIYPHVNNWAERAEDGFRVANKADRDNVFCTFNLYHWLKVEGPDDLERKAKAVLPRLNCVTINGSMNNARDIDVKAGIMPLGDGDYDVEAFVKTFIDLGYKGPIGLQGYGIGGDIEAKLKQSMEQWKGYCARIE